MKNSSSSSPSTPNTPKPEYTPPPGDVPKKFPEKQPLADSGVQADKKAATNRESEGEGIAEHSGEDREVESGIDHDDPEHPLHAEGDEAMK